MEGSCHLYSRIGFAKNPLSFSFSNRYEATQRSIFSLPFPKNTKMASCCIKGNSHFISNLQAKKSNNIICENIDKDCEGLGIVSFLRGKNFLITGATGFLAKGVLIEKILREIPDVGEIYVIIKAKDDEAAKDRLLNEIVNTELFRSLKEMHGKNYKDFMLRKMIPVLGNLRESNIGIKPEMLEEISQKVEIIVNSAANTNFDERYDVALDINTIGPFRLMSFAKRMKRLKLFLHVSTAYVNGQRQGVVSEKTFLQGDTISSEIRSGEKITVLNIEEEIKLAFESAMKDASISQKMKELGLERARLYGWQDTYVFTKAMGEMVINSMRGDIPVVTIRPSVIESTFQQPFPGWMEGNKVMDPVVQYYGKGQLTGFLVDPDGVLDVVPVDMVVNATLAAMAKHGSKSDTGMHIYHVASSSVNPLLFNHLFDIFFDHFSRSPYVDPKGRFVGPIQPVKMFVDKNEFIKYVSKDAIEKTKKLEGLVENEKIYERSKAMIMKVVKQVMYMATIYEPYTFYGGRFDNANTEKLLDEMSDEERKKFHFDVRSINWKDYLDYVHIPGLRKHVMKEREL